MNREHAEAVAVIEAQIGEYVKIDEATKSNGRFFLDREPTYRRAAALNAVENAIRCVKRGLGYAENDAFALRENPRRNWPNLGVELRIQALKLAVEDFETKIPF